ncbi:MAG: dicarboxylate/amino acid:cation symporter [Clostridiales Family XIII bacterium]|jgi:Na+/H+-dicarboxylate symporter|nr:dicarboxylate/amino acid:cation symporter [Clostridiales Family XIII bacterium]
MSFDLVAAAGLVTVFALFAIIYFLRVRLKVGFTKTILGAMVVGIAVGILYSGHTDWIAPIGTIYVSVLTAIVAPLIIVSILSSVTSLGSVNKLKTIGLKSVFWLLVTTVIAIFLALGLGLAFNLGTGANFEIEGVNTQMYADTVKPVSQVIIDLFPENVIDDIAGGKIIPMILFAVLIAVSYVLVANNHKEKVVIFKRFIEALREIIFKAVGFIIELTPYAVMALMATSVGSKLNNSEIMWALGLMLIISFVAFIIDTWIVGGVLIRAFADLNPLVFFKKILPAQIVAFSTQASAGALPVTTRVLREDIGVAPEIADFTAPLGTTIGMPGCAGIWPVITVIFGVNALGISYGIKDYAMLALISLFVSLGTAGVPGTATITTASVLTALGLPLEILVLTIPISSIADTGRTATNVSAAMIAATIVGRKENAIDEDIFYDRKTYSEAEENEAEVSIVTDGNLAAAVISEGGSGGDLDSGGEYRAEDEGIHVGACKIEF